MAVVQRENIAIIGTGIAGLSAAWLLGNDHNISIFEQAAKPGMGIYSVDVTHTAGNFRVDIPLRVFTPAYYPHLAELYRRAGIQTEITNHAAAYADASNQIFFHYGNKILGRINLSYPKALNWLKDKRWLSLLAHRKFFRRIQQLNIQTLASQLTFADFIAQEKLDTPYLRNILLPALATVCTCDYADVLHYPAQIILQYLNCGVMADGVMRASQGVDGVIAALLEPTMQLHTQAPIESVNEHALGVQVVLQNGDTHHFDRVIIATQPHQAAKLLPSEHPYQIHLQQIPVCQSRMQLHSDTNLLPSSSVALSPVTYFLPTNGQRPEACVDLRKAIKHFANGPAVFQVWNPIRPVAAEHLLADVQFSRPLVTVTSRAASTQLREAQRSTPRILLSGSYLCDGIPLLDGAVEASLTLARLLGSSRTW
jgi:uncharacterized protein